MIDNSVLDNILPVPDQDELRENMIDELTDEGFVISNYASGGVFHTLLMIVIKIYIELTQLLRSVLNHTFASHATGTWLDLKANDYSKKRKQAEKTQGMVTLTRTDTINPLLIKKGHVFKTLEDIQGVSLRYFVIENTLLESSVSSINIAVEAEQAGADYNVPVNQITQTLTHIEGDITITNATNWITSEGCDVEGDESLRSRILRSWSELATRPIADLYKNVCEGIAGVLLATVDDEHPRGQGTVDIIITGTAGTATEQLLETVRQEVAQVAGTYDNIEVRSASTTAVDVHVKVTIAIGTNTTEVENGVIAVLTDLLAINKGRQFNQLTHMEIILAISEAISAVKNIKVLEPTDDLTLGIGEVIVLGNVTVTVESV